MVKLWRQTLTQTVGWTDGQIYKNMCQFICNFLIFLSLKNKSLFKKQVKITTYSCLLHIQCLFRQGYRITLLLFYSETVTDINYLYSVFSPTCYSFINDCSKQSISVVILVVTFLRSASLLLEEHSSRVQSFIGTVVGNDTIGA